MNARCTTTLGTLFTCASLCGAAPAPPRPAAASPLLCEPYEAEYRGEDATGKHVIALWQFNAGAETKDASGRGHDLKFQGAQPGPAGRFGGGLESFPGYPVQDKRHGALAAHGPGLTPRGAFSIEFWMKPKAELEGYPECFVLDKKYVDHTDFQVVLGRPGKRNDVRSWHVALGFGIESETYSSDPLQYPPGQWHHVAFTYDGAGTGAFTIDGMPAGRDTRPGRKNIVPGTKPLSIGDRIGSLYHGFPGLIDQVRLCDGVREFCPARFAFGSERTSFRRMEPAQTLRFVLTNLLRAPLTGAVARVSLGGQCEKSYALPEIPSGQTTNIDYALDTSLRPDTYILKAAISIPGPRPYRGEESFPITLVARRTPHTMPVIMWGGAGQSGEEIQRMREIGFTHCLGLACDSGKIWDEGKPTAQCAEPEAVAASKRLLNLCLANNFGIVAGLSPGSWLRRSQDRLRRIDPKGAPYGGAERDKGDVCGQFPEAQKFCHDVGASVARTYGAFPALEAAMIHTEVRGHTKPCFHEIDRAAYRKFAGSDIPPEISGSSRGADYQSVKGFPADRIVPDNHPILAYWRWFWTEGDGWNRMHTAVHKGLKTNGLQNCWTYHDPAVRAPSIWGSGGGVDILSQWTYSYPDPIRIGCATDELFAMAKGGPPGQGVMKMTQIIWYRSQTAPVSQQSQEAVRRQSVWEDTDPDAAFITIAPMHLREAFWTKISRPIRGIMYHGWGSLVDGVKHTGYRYTHPQTRHELARLIRTVVRPLGPTLLQVPGVKSDVAFLESFTAQMFAKRGTYGWNGRWEGDAYHIVQYAGLQPEIVYDDTILRDGLDAFKLLFMMGCDVLTENVARRVKEFQKRGGLVVGDEFLAPAIHPDIRIPSYERIRKADQDKAALLGRAAKLRAALAPRYTRTLESSNPEVVTYRRRACATDYVFAINDRREFGQYVGQHGLVMENGLPSDTVLTLERNQGAVYDLVRHERIDAQLNDGKLAIPARLGPCEGRLFMVAPAPIEGIRVTAPPSAARGATCTIAIDVTDADGKPVDAVCPIEVEILDAEGRPAEFSGHYGAVAGRQTIAIALAPNDTPGTWTVSARELASGRSATIHLRVVAAR